MLFILFSEFWAISQCSLFSEDKQAEQCERVFGTRK